MIETSARVGSEPGFAQLLAANAHNHANEPALSWEEEDGITRTYTWSQYREAVLEVAAGLLDLGLNAGDVVGILASNRAEHLVADHAIRHCGAVPVSLYLTMSAHQAQHVLADCGPAILILEGAAAVERFSRVPWVAQQHPVVVTLDVDAPSADTVAWSDLHSRGKVLLPDVVDELTGRVAGVSLDDPATLIYTSGTTGNPKGVVITHRNLLWDVNAIVDAGIVDYPLSAVSYLPLAHITERVSSIYLALRTGAHIHACPDMNKLLPTLQKHRPTLFMGVPRVWEKLGSGAELFMTSTALGPHADQLASDRRLLLEHWHRQVGGEPIDAAMSLAAAAARDGLLRQVRAFLGLERAYAASGAAALRPETLEFFASIGLRISQAYGLTETSGPAVSEVPDAPPSRGSVGVPLPGCEVRIAEDGEILIRCPGNTPGYHHLPDATSALIDPEGWLHTGDIGRLDEAGRLYITDRKKEIIVTSAGKNVAPQAVENLLVGRSFISQVVAVGDARPFIAALITPDRDLLERFATAHQLGDLALTELVEHPTVTAEVGYHIAWANEKLSRPEQIKTWKLLPTSLSIEDDTLTPTFKLKRRVVAERYSKEIDGLYERS